MYADLQQTKDFVGTQTGQSLESPPIRMDVDLTKQPKSVTSPDTIIQQSPIRDSVDKNQEIKRFVFQLDNIIEFSKDDASDITTLVMLIEQSLN